MVDGVRYSGELHFVHTRAGNEYCVVGVPLVDNPATPFDDTIWDALGSKIPSYPNTNEVDDIELTDMLPSDLDYYHYHGSLTTPPCNETVEWFLLKNSINVPTNFFDLLRTTGPLGQNYREAQPLNHRQVYEFISDDDDD